MARLPGGGGVRHIESPLRNMPSPPTFLTSYHHKRLTYFNLHLVASGAPVPLFALKRLSKIRLEFGIMVLRLLAAAAGVQNLGSHLDFRKIGVRIPKSLSLSLRSPLRFSEASLHS